MNHLLLVVMLALTLSGCASVAKWWDTQLQCWAMSSEERQRVTPDHPCYEPFTPGAWNAVTDYVIPGAMWPAPRGK